MVDRYAITTGGVYNHNLGEWVKVSDYEKLKAERDALSEEIQHRHNAEEALKQKFIDLDDEIIALQAERDALKSENERLRKKNEQLTDATEILTPWVFGPDRWHRPPRRRTEN